MSRPIPESDWKIFRELRLVALDRFCERALARITEAAADPGKTNHARYLTIWDVMSEHDKVIAHAFNDVRRSTAFLTLVAIQSLDVLTAEELARFSPETVERLRAFGTQ
jgi:hypothetical protein